MKAGPVTVEIKCNEYYTFSKSFDEYIPKYGGYVTTEYPESRNKDDIMWIFLIYTVDGKVVRKTTMVDWPSHDFKTKVETPEGAVEL